MRLIEDPPQLLGIAIFWVAGDLFQYLGRMGWGWGVTQDGGVEGWRDVTVTVTLCTAISTRISSPTYSLQHCYGHLI